MKIVIQPMHVYIIVKVEYMVSYFRRPYLHKPKACERLVSGGSYTQR